MGNSKIKIIAHRGKGPTSHLSGEGSLTGDVPSPFVPENTLKAFEQAIKEGADGIEFDIYISKDGVPVVSHDDSLNIHVVGADRSDTNLGLISQKTLKEIREFDVGQGELIPTLEETVELFVKHNKERKLKGLEPLIMNVELKGPGTAEATWKLITRYIDSGSIRKEDVVYCSFKHDELLKIRKLDKQAQISPAIDSATWFGKENIIEPGWFVPLSVDYHKKAFDNLKGLMSDVAPTSLDPVLYDIDRPLVEFAKEHNIGLYASTSNFRDFSNKAFLYFLFNIGKEVPVYFKTDEPGAIRSMLEDMKPVLDIDLSRVLVLESTEVSSLREEQLARIPKVGQPETTMIIDPIKLEERAKALKSVAQKMLLNTSTYLKLYLANDISKEDVKALTATIQSFSYLRPYIGKALSIEETVVSNITDIFDKTAGAIARGEPISPTLRSRIGYFLTEIAAPRIQGSLPEPMPPRPIDAARSTASPIKAATQSAEPFPKQLLDAAHRAAGPQRALKPGPQKLLPEPKHSHDRPPPDQTAEPASSISPVGISDALHDAVVTAPFEAVVALALLSIFKPIKSIYKTLTDRLSTCVTKDATEEVLAQTLKEVESFDKPCASIINDLSKQKSMSKTYADAVKLQVELTKFKQELRVLQKLSREKPLSEKKLKEVEMHTAVIATVLENIGKECEKFKSRMPSQPSTKGGMAAQPRPTPPKRIR